MSDKFDALAHPVRREILQLLRKKAMSAGEIAEHFTLSKPTLSGHFSVLKAADLVTTERQGTTIIYRLNMSALEEAIGALMDIAQSKKGSAKWLFARS
jgi:ArsR family transcriptional regulator, arsenate/arsenite/antimonite-responsive transcriptional repressor